MVGPEAQGQGRQDPAPLTEERMKKPMTLNELTEEEKRFVLWMQEEGSEEDQALIDTYEMIKLDFKEKADSYGKVIKSLDKQMAILKAEEDWHKEEAKRLAAHRATIGKNVERMEGVLLNALVETGRVNRSGNPEWKTDLYTFGMRKSSSVVVTEKNVYKIPDDYLRYKDPEPDKDKIKTYLKDNPECEWAHMETKVSLSLR